MKWLKMLDVLILNCESARIQDRIKDILRRGVNRVERT
jgi:hypothetical protein